MILIQEKEQFFWLSRKWKLLGLGKLKTRFGVHSLVSWCYLFLSENFKGIELTMASPVCKN